MEWFTRGDAASEPGVDATTGAEPAPARPTPVIFEPQPMDDDGWDDVAVKPGDDLPAYKPPVLLQPEAKPAGKGKGKKSSVALPPAATGENDRRTPLQKHLAEITEQYKDEPIEEMTGPIREALMATGREIPDDWILAIAEGLRVHGPMPLNLDGPGKRAT
jgi:hypothetical protein